ncbi:MAG: transposase [Microbacterium sp.]|nr:transposase [Microbacterium sp.]
MSVFVDEVAAALYAGPPETFIRERNARAAEAAHPDEAKMIRALRKPTVAAWVVNVFASERAAQLEQALQLATELRDAQDDLDAATLAQLGRERRALTTRLAADAADLAAARGGRVTESTREAVRQTISAAFFSADAAVAVSSGRLVHELEPSDDVDLADAVGGGQPVVAATPAQPADELSARRERRRAEKAVHDAEHALARAERVHADAERRHRDIARRRDELAHRIAELEDELARARTQHADAQMQTSRAMQQGEQTSALVETARRAASEAQDALDALSHGRD